MPRRDSRFGFEGKMVNGNYQRGLLDDDELENIVQLILSRGGRVKNLYGADGKKISYYQINATFYSALGENEQKMLLARAIQLFMPGVPQVWYLDVFAGKNDDEAVERAGADGHKEINRTNLSLQIVEESLKKSVVLRQLDLIKFRNNAVSFAGKVNFMVDENPDFGLKIEWKNGEKYARLEADLLTHRFTIYHNEDFNLDLNF